MSPKFDARSAAAAAGLVAGVPLQLVERIDRALDDLTGIARGVEAMHAEFIGMREDIRTVDEHVSELRGEIRGLRDDITEPVADVTPMFAAVREINGRVEGLGDQLVSVDRLARRFSLFGRRRNRKSRQAAAEIEGTAEEQLAEPPGPGGG